MTASPIPKVLKLAVRRVVLPPAVKEDVMPAVLACVIPDESAILGTPSERSSAVVVTGVESVGRFFLESLSLSRSIASQCSIHSRW